VIYFIQNRTNKAIKIGYTSGSAYQRLSRLQTGSADPLEVLAEIDGQLEDERRLHEQFRDHRMAGEWFKPCDELMLEISSLRGIPDAVRILRQSGQVFPELCYLASMAVGHRVEIFYGPAGHQVMPDEEAEEDFEVGSFWNWQLDKPQWFKTAELACCAYVANYHKWVAEGRPQPG
jgi:hypothetical protein